MRASFRYIDNVKKNIKHKEHPPPTSGRVLLRDKLALYNHNLAQSDFCYKMLFHCNKSHNVEKCAYMLLKKNISPIYI